MVMKAYKLFEQPFSGNHYNLSKKKKNFLITMENNQKQTETAGVSPWKRRMAPDNFPMFITFFPQYVSSIRHHTRQQNLNRILNRLASLSNQRVGFGVISTAGKWAERWQIHKGGALNFVLNLPILSLDPWTRLSWDCFQTIQLS